MLVNADPEINSQENENLLEKNPEIAARMQQQALAWRQSLPSRHSEGR